MFLVSKLKLVLSLVLFLILSGCNGDYTHQLPNGYSLTRIYSGASLITDQNSKVILGPSKYGILVGIEKQFILGNLDTEENAFDVNEVPDRFFIVNTENGSVYKELTIEEFKKKI
jgi:hypothetical protein